MHMKFDAEHEHATPYMAELYIWTWWIVCLSESRR